MKSELPAVVAAPAAVAAGSSSAAAALTPAGRLERRIAAVYVTH